MNKHNKPIKITVEFTDEIIDLCDFVKMVLAYEPAKKESAETDKKEAPLLE